MEYLEQGVGNQLGTIQYRFWTAESPEERIKAAAEFREEYERVFLERAEIPRVLQVTYTLSHPERIPLRRYEAHRPSAP